ncbi:MAG: response regulator, partial [Methanothrix sp.]|nr:response regulator [Methanothrix sp.]
MMQPQLESQAQSILVVDDDPAMCQMLEEVLTQEGYRAITCLRPEDALAVSRQDSFQLAFVDIHMPGMSGLELAAKLKEDDARREVVFITGSTVVDHAVQAIKLGAYDYLRKPFTITEFKLCLKRFQERIRLKERIQRAEQRYFRLVQTLPLLIYVLRRDWQLDFINQACVQILGYTPEEALETPRWLLTRVHPEDRDRIEKTIHSIFAAGEPPATLECRLVHKNGHTIHAMAKFIPSWDSNGGRVAEYLEGIMVDISDHVFLEKALVQKEKLNTLGAISAEVAHEIRNPLVSIGGFARRLQAKYPELSEVDIILRESQRLERILDRIRNYLKPVEIRPQDCAVNDLLNDCVCLLAPEIERYSIYYRMDLEVEDPLVCADRDVLSQVFINLIRNAIVAMKKSEAFAIRTYKDVRGV